MRLDGLKKALLRIKMTITTKRLVNFTIIVVILVIWYVISMVVEPIFIPSPVDVFVRTYTVYNEILVSSILYSLMRVFLGFLIGSLVGFVLGIVISWNKILEWLFDPLIEIVRPIPVIALIPLFILWFGLGEIGKVLLIAFGCFVRQVVTTREAIKNVPTVYLKAAQTLGATQRVQLFRTIILPSITPEMIGGLRVTVAAAFGYCAAAEFLGAQSGIGYIIIIARRYLYTFAVIFGIIIFGLLAWGADGIVRYIDRRINVWTERENR